MADEEVLEDVVEDTEELGGGEDSLSDDLEAAWEASESESEAGGDGDVSAASDNGHEPSGDNADSGGPAADYSEDQVPAEQGSVGKPPLDWSPELREEWGGLPAGVKTQIANRESQMAQAMQGTSQARRVAQEFTGVANRYGSVMAAEGVSNPVQMFDSVMQTVSELRMGTTQQKASKMAQLIQNYGIDIQSLDDALAGTISGEPAAPGGNPDMEAMINQRMAPVNDMMQQLAGMQQQKQQASARAAQQEVDQFAQGAEFLNDVRHDVADLIDMATRQGREMPLQEAYEKACSMNPQIMQVMTQRMEQERLSGSQQGIAGKRNAGSSLRPGNLGSGPKQGAGTLHDTISAAWDDQLGG